MCFLFSVRWLIKLSNGGLFATRMAKKATFLWIFWSQLQAADLQKSHQWALQLPPPPFTLRPPHKDLMHNSFFCSVCTAQQFWSCDSGFELLICGGEGLAWVQRFLQNVGFTLLKVLDHTKNKTALLTKKDTLWFLLKQHYFQPRGAEWKATFGHVQRGVEGSVSRGRREGLLPASGSQIIHCCKFSFTS